MRVGHHDDEDVEDVDAVQVAVEVVQQLAEEDAHEDGDRHADAAFQLLFVARLEVQLFQDFGQDQDVQQSFCYVIYYLDQECVRGFFVLQEFGDLKF